MNAFIDEHRARCGVEPICTALQVAPSAYRRYAARQRHPALLPQRAKRDALLLPEVQRVFDENLRVYGADKVWRPEVRHFLPFFARPVASKPNGIKDLAHSLAIRV